MEQRVSLITLGVTDLPRSRNFYQHLGSKRSPPDGQGFGGITLAYNTRIREEVDSVLAQAETAGAKLLKPAQEALWGGYDGYFADPDGFLWEVSREDSWRK
jgi:uncharacterized protein